MDKQSRTIDQPTSDAGELGPTAEPEFPQLTKIRAMDRQLHIERAMEMGMSREEAERHAEHDLNDREAEGRLPPSEGPA